MTWRALWSRVRGSLRRDDGLEREMDREMEFHLDMSARHNVERGMTPEAARRQAKLVFGSVDAFKETAREAQRARVAEEVLSDIRFALRSLGRSPSFAVAAVLTVALGIGASTAMFTVVNATLLRPLPIPQPEDFTYVGWVWARGNEIPALTALQFEFVRDHNRTFEAVATYRTDETHVGDESAALPLRGLGVSGGFFHTVGFTPRLGRAFDARELAAGGPAVVILSDDVWRTRFGGDAGIVGRQIRLDDELHTVVGVLSPKFRFPPATQHTGYLVPLVVHVNPADEGHNSDVIGRLRHGTPEAARAADLRALTSAFRAAYPSLAREGESFRLFTHNEVYVGSAGRHTIWVLFGAVSLVLLIACANTAMLLLVRASARQREIAVRASIGAGRARILQQLLTEGLVLSAIAATLGVFFSIIAVRSFLAVAPNALPQGAEPGIDVRVLAYAIAVPIATGLIFGLAAAVPAYRVRLQSALLGGTRAATAGSRGIREGLVFLETAVAVVLLCGATLLTASFARLIRVDPGFDADRVAALRLGRLPPQYDDATRHDRLVDRLLERVRALPGVERAAAAPSLPLERGLNFPVDIPERPELAIGAVELRFVSPDYFATLGVPLRAGRDFDASDVAGAEPVAIVNEAFARHFWDDASPLGRSIRIGHFKSRWRVDADAQHHTRVIGIAADIRELGLDRAAKPTVLLPRAQTDWGSPLLLVRGTAPRLLDALRAEVVAEEPQLAPEVERLSSVVSRSVAEPRFRTLLVAAFAGFALLLAGVGIYGVIASIVQQSRRDIGIRLTLGAGRAAVALAVARRCLANVAAGTLVGLLVFWATRRVLASWLYEIAPGDPLVLTITVAVIVLVATFASWIPARRAALIDPATSLRLE
ncbi:MAG: ADOP family duplicated permease [Longimicrobiales bacterium]